MEMNRVNPGQFIMGAPSGAAFQNSDEVERQVTLTQGFYLGKYEVTQKEWLTVMGSWPGNAPGVLGDWLPAVNVSWTDIKQVGGFLHQLNTMVGCDISSLPSDIVTRYNPANVGPGCYRLPTAAEWEYSAKAGTNTLWSFGNDSAQADAYAWHLGNSSSTIKKVGQKLPNPWNFYDIHGYVGEFVFDRAGVDSSNPRTDPTGPDQYVGPNPMHRGGANSLDIGYARSAKPGNGGTDNRQNNLGFRLLRTLD
jgi:formylglycine-generating enzyme required for sulfatase activity